MGPMLCRLNMTQKSYPRGLRLVPLVLCLCCVYYPMLKPQWVPVLNGNAHAPTIVLEYSKLATKPNFTTDVEYSRKFVVNANTGLKPVTYTNLEKPSNSTTLHHTNIEEGRRIGVTKTPSDSETAEMPSSSCPNSRRVEHLRKACQGGTAGADHMPNYRALAVDEKHKLLLCLPPKAGSTSWKMILANNHGGAALQGQDRDYSGLVLHGDGLSRRHSIHSLARFSRRQRQHIIDTYFKVMVVRHPLDRLVSAYINKFTDNQGNLEVTPMGQQMLKGFNHSSTDKLSAIKFMEFLTYIQHEKSISNVHWKPMHEICHPCQIQYDYIVKLETQTLDSEYIIDKYLGPFRRRNVHVYNKSQSSKALRCDKKGKLLRHFSNVPEDLFHRVVEKVVQRDMDLFGYTFERSANGSVTAYCDC